MSDFSAAFAKIKKSVVGIGIRNDPEYQIIGTGFILDEKGLIATNRHVLEGIADFMQDGIKVKRGAAVFLFFEVPHSPEFRAVTGFATVDIAFVAAPPNGAVTARDLDEQIERGEITAPRLNGKEFDQMIHPETLDIGVCAIEPKGLPSKALPLRALKIIHSRGVREGTPVGVIGFPRGLFVPEKFSSISQIQMTPLLQVGVISGLLPVTGDPKPNRFVLDMMINQGSSGSPLILQNGDVVGIVHATRIVFHPLSVLDKDASASEHDAQGVYVPSGLGLAIPSARFPDTWLETKTEKEKKKQKLRHRM